MTNGELKALRQQVKDRIASLQSLLAGDQESDDGRQQSDDEDARMDQQISSAVSSRITLAEKQELARLQANLKWLAGDDAGCCEICGSEIPMARLQAVPTTRLCINCAS